MWLDFDVRDNRRCTFSLEEDYYGLWTCILVKNVLMDLSQLLSSQDVNWWTGVVWITCGLLWCFYQLFGLSFWRHPFTAVELMSARHHRLGQTSCQLVLQHLHYLITIVLSPIIGSVDLKYENVQHMQRLIVCYSTHLQTTDYASQPWETDESTSYRTVMRDNVIKIQNQRHFSSVIFSIVWY